MNVQTIIDKDMSEKQSFYRDVCIICALPEEVASFIKIVRENEGVKFEKDFATNNREYRKTKLVNHNGESLQVSLFWPPAYGPVEASLLINEVLREFQPRFIGMVGICAGDKREVKLGDLLIASKAFTYDSGKFKTTSGGTK